MNSKEALEKLRRLAVKNSKSDLKVREYASIIEKDLECLEILKERLDEFFKNNKELLDSMKDLSKKVFDAIYIG